MYYMLFIVCGSFFFTSCSSNERILICEVDANSDIIIYYYSNINDIQFPIPANSNIFEFPTSPMQLYFNSKKLSSSIVNIGGTFTLSTNEKNLPFIYSPDKKYLLYENYDYVYHGYYYEIYDIDNDKEISFPPKEDLLGIESNIIWRKDKVMIIDENITETLNIKSGNIIVENVNITNDNYNSKGVK